MYWPHTHYKCTAACLWFINTLLPWMSAPPNSPTSWCVIKVYCPWALFCETIVSASIHSTTVNQHSPSLRLLPFPAKFSMLGMDLGRRQQPQTFPSPAVWNPRSVITRMSFLAASLQPTTSLQTATWRRASSMASGLSWLVTVFMASIEFWNRAAMLFYLSKRWSWETDLCSDYEKKNT